jgi:beta-lactamase regulating signal transducer with metallopeptidase domain
MGVGVSLILIAAGAVMAWAVHVTSNGLNVNTVGYILLVVGIVGLLLSLMFWSTWAGPGYFTRRRTVTDAGRGGRRTIIEDESAY